MIRAIKTRQLEYLYAVYAYNQNFEILSYDEDALSESDHHSVDGEDDNYFVFTFDWLFKRF